MNIKNNKGVTGIDVTVAIIIITMFTGLIASMFYNVDASRKELERNSKASEIAITTIEQIKQMNYLELPGSETSTKTIEQLNQEMNQTNGEAGYKIEIQIQNYKDIKQNQDLEDRVKTVKVKVTYTSNNKQKDVEISTAIVR